MDVARAIIVIPARLGSTRLPRKMLLADSGKPLIQHTVEAARQSRLASDVMVGTEDPEIVVAVTAFGGHAVLTGQHDTGTDRVAEVARQFPDVEWVVNVQGDEPEIDPGAIDRLIELLARHPGDDMATLAVPIRDEQKLNDPACVKVVFDRTGRALYFSRSPIPHPRDGFAAATRGGLTGFYQHLGVYAYRADFLQQFGDLPPSDLEKTERLEQLRVLQAGRMIRVGVVENAHKGIDTLDDYRAFVRRQRSGPAGSLARFLQPPRTW